VRCEFLIRCVYKATETNWTEFSLFTLWNELKLIKFSRTASSFTLYGLCDGIARIRTTVTYHSSELFEFNWIVISVQFSSVEFISDALYMFLQSICCMYKWMLCVYTGRRTHFRWWSHALASTTATCFTLTPAVHQSLTPMVYPWTRMLHCCLTRGADLSAANEDLM